MDNGPPDSWTVPGALFFAVWTIYLADRLYDAFRASNLESLPPRHRFARRNWRLLGALMLLLAGWLLARLAPQLDHGVLLVGLGLALLTAGYFAAFRLRRIHPAIPAKEFVIGISFAIGIFFAAGTSHPTAAEIVCGAAMTALFVANCLAISLAERNYDSHSDPAAFYSEGLPSVGIPLFLLAASILLSIAAFLSQRLGAVAATVIACSLLTVPILKKATDSPDATQPLADAVLLLPWIVLAIKSTVLGG